MLATDRPGLGGASQSPPIPSLPQSRRDFTVPFRARNEVLILAYFALAISRRSLRTRPPSTTFSIAPVPFAAAFFKPVLMSMALGRAARDAFTCFVVSTIASFLPSFTESTDSTALFARPLYLKEFTPQMLPGSAVKTSLFPGFLLPKFPIICVRPLRMKLELFFTHSQTRSGDAMANGV